MEAPDAGTRPVPTSASVSPGWTPGSGPLNVGVQPLGAAAVVEPLGGRERRLAPRHENRPDEVRVAV